MKRWERKASMFDAVSPTLLKHINPGSKSCEAVLSRSIKNPPCLKSYNPKFCSCFGWWCKCFLFLFCQFIFFLLNFCFLIFHKVPMCVVVAYSIVLCIWAVHCVSDFVSGWQSQPEFLGKGNALFRESSFNCEMFVVFFERPDTNNTYVRAIVLLAVKSLTLTTVVSFVSNKPCSKRIFQKDMSGILIN